jgi:hypothetical protein
MAKQQLAGVPILSLTRRGIAGHYRGSAFGILWSLLTLAFIPSLFTFVFGAAMKAKWAARDASANEHSIAQLVVIPVNGSSLFSHQPAGDVCRSISPCRHFRSPFSAGEARDVTFPFRTTVLPETYFSTLTFTHPRKSIRQIYRLIDGVIACIPSDRAIRNIGLANPILERDYGSVLQKAS